MEPLQILLAIGALIVSLAGFIGALMLAVIGYFLKSFHAEYKTDKALDGIREVKSAEKLTQMSEAWSTRLDELFEKLVQKINNLPKGSDGLSQVFIESERQALGRERALHERLNDHASQLQAHNSQFASQHDRIETVAGRVHEIGNAVTPGNLRDQMEKRRKAKLAAHKEPL